MEVVAQADLLMQFGQTQRYHTEVLLKPQDVGQHSFNVAWLCWLLSEKEPSADLIMAALAHDAGERKTGDLPSPTKKATGLGDQFDELERRYVERAGYVQGRLSLIERQILKLADTLEGCYFCLREVRLGNRLMTSVRFGGAALNFMQYVPPLLEEMQAPGPKAIGTLLYNSLKEEFYELSNPR